MLASGRTGIVCKIVLLVSLLVMMTTLTLIMHAIMSNRRSFLHRASVRHNPYPKFPPSGGGGGGGVDGSVSGSSSSRVGSGGRPERGLMALITNVTKTVIAMEMQATSLNDELKSMQEKTRELLMQQRHSALWTALHKCVFFHNCKDQNVARSSPQTIAQSLSQSSAQSTASPADAREKNRRVDKRSGDRDSVVSLKKRERKYSMYRLRRRS